MKRIVMLLSVVITAAAGGVLSTSQPTQAAPPPGYVIVDLGTLSGDTNSAAVDINNAGLVAGYSSVRDPGPGGATLNRATFFSPSTVQALGALPGHDSSVAYRVNERGDAVGHSGSAGTCCNQAVRYSGGRTIALGMLPGDIGSVAAGVNETGQAVGISLGAENGSHAVRFERGLVMALGALPGDNQSEAFDINDAGQAVGISTGTSTQAVRFDGGVVVPLGVLPGADSSFAIAINDIGQAVGTSGGMAVRFDLHAVVALGRLPGHTVSDAFDINNRGEAVGRSCDATDGCRAVLFRDGEVIDLTPAATGWTLTTAVAINEHGQIVGSGQVGGTSHAFLLSPVLPTRLTAEPALIHLGAGTVTFDLTAVLTKAGGIPVALEPVRFTAGGRTLCVVFTDVSGNATCKGQTLAATLAGGYRADFAGNLVYLPSSARGSIVA